MSSYSSHTCPRPRPRPILKNLPPLNPGTDLNPSSSAASSSFPFANYPLHSPHVHFPPTPTLTSTTTTFSPFVYDRAPIVVAENVCALPKRNERCYELCGSERDRRGRKATRDKKETISIRSAAAGAAPGCESTIKGSYFHPRAFEVCEPEPLDRSHHYLYHDDGDDHNHKNNSVDHGRYHSPYINDTYSPSSSSSSSSSPASSCPSSDSSSDLMSPGSDYEFPRACASVYTSLSSFSMSSPPYARSPSIPRGAASSSRSPARDATSSRPTYPSSMYQDYSTLSMTSGDKSMYSARSDTTYALDGGQQKAKVKSKKKGGGGSDEGRLNRAARLAKLSGGFSDQSFVLDGCLGGF